MVERDAVVDPATMKELFPHVALTPVRELIRRMKEKHTGLLALAKKTGPPIQAASDH